MSLPLASTPSGVRIPLPGIEADNLLGFLALLGTLRAIEHVDPELAPRASWEESPWIASLHLRREVAFGDLASLIASGCASIADAFDIDGKANVSFDRKAFRAYAERVREDPINSMLAGALAAEWPAREGKNVRASPLVLMFGSGHQNFLERLVAVPKGELPKRLEQRKKKPDFRSPEKIAEALFRPWTRMDDADAFRWDAEEDQRYALRFGDPSRAGAAPTVVGANRLAAIGFLSFACVPGMRLSRTTGAVYRDNEIRFVWPLWSQPLSLRAIEIFLGHPSLLQGDLVRMKPLGVTEILAATRVENGRFLNVTRALPHRPAARGVER